MKKLFLTAASLVLLTSASFAGNTSWTSTSGNPLWNFSANWNAGVPNWTTTAVLENDLTTVFSIDIQSGTSTLDPVQGIIFNAGAGASAFTIRSSSTAPGGFSITTGGIVNNDTRSQTFNVPFTMVSPSGLGGSSANQTWNAAAGNLVISGTYGTGSTQPTLNNNAGTLTINGAYNTTIGLGTGRGDIVGTGGLVKNGTGTLFLGGANGNTFSGGLTLNAGTIVAGKSAALGTGTVRLNGGLVQANFNNLNSGALNLQGNAMLDFSGPGVFTLPSVGTNILSFGDSHSISWLAGTTLTIENWVQGDMLRFGTSNTGLTAGQLGQIVFDGYPTSYAAIDGSGYVTPVPEPSTLALSLLGGFGLAISVIMRRRKN